MSVSKVMGHHSHGILSINDKTLYMQHVLFIFCFGGTISLRIVPPFYFIQKTLWNTINNIGLITKYMSKLFKKLISFLPKSFIKEKPTFVATGRFFYF